MFVWSGEGLICREQRTSKKGGGKNLDGPGRAGSTKFSVAGVSERPEARLDFVEIKDECYGSNYNTCVRAELCFG